MKNINTIILAMALAVIASSCSSVKLSDAWSSDAIAKTKNNKVLVVARSTDMDIRKSYENEIVSKLKNDGIDAVAANIQFPDLKEKTKRNQSEIDVIVKRFTDAGIESVLLTALKDTKIEQPAPKETHSDDISTTNVGRYGISFSDYYNVHSIEHLNSGLRPRENDDDVIDGPNLKSTTYVLEAVLYDLTLANDKQLVGTYEVEAINPKSAELVLEKFSSIIAKQIKN